MGRSKRSNSIVETSTRKLRSHKKDSKVEIKEKPSIEDAEKKVEDLTSTDEFNKESTYSNEDESNNKERHSSDTSNDRPSFSNSEQKSTDEINDSNDHHKNDEIDINIMPDEVGEEVQTNCQLNQPKPIDVKNQSPTFSPPVSPKKNDANSNGKESKVEYSDLLSTAKIKDKPKQITEKPIESEKSPSECFSPNQDLQLTCENLTSFEKFPDNIPPKQSPSLNPPTCIIHIRNLVRPFLVNHLKAMLCKEDLMIESSFWIDRIKSHCFATYESIEAAQRALDRLCGLRWPPGSPKTLIVDFSTAAELDKYTSEDSFDHRGTMDTQRAVREWDLPKLDTLKEKAKDSAEIAVTDGNTGNAKKADNGKILDDLFRKTLNKPSIYWLPLTEEQVNRKAKEMLRRKEEEKARMESNRIRKLSPRPLSREPRKRFRDERSRNDRRSPRYQRRSDSRHRHRQRSRSTKAL